MVSVDYYYENGLLMYKDNVTGVAPRVGDSVVSPFNMTLLTVKSAEFWPARQTVKVVLNGNG